MGARGRRAASERDPGAEAGFTLIELTVAMALLAIVMLGFAGAVYGSMNAWAAARQRSAFIEIANAEMETLRALPYDVVGVNKTKDPSWAAAYDGAGRREGRDHVDVTSIDTANRAPLTVTTVTSSPVRGIVVPYTVRRWVTWTDMAAGAGHLLKRLEVRVEWNENNRSPRSLTLTSVHYPGGKGSSAANDAPVPGFTVSPSSSVGIGSTVTFDAATTVDPQGDAVSYSWNFGDGTTVSTAGVSTTSHAYGAAGVYTVVLTATDSRGDAASTARDINVGSGVNTAPVASFTRTPSSGVAPLTVNVDANGSSDPNGDALDYSWNWGDGTAAGSGVNASHVFESAGLFTIVLTVTDPSGATSTATSQVLVTPLNCDVTAGWFRNPGNNGTTNDIDVFGNSKPESLSFTFVARSNSACSSITARLPYAGGVWSVPLTPISSVNGVVTWAAASTFNSSERFSTGNLQTAEMWSPGSTGNSDRFSYTFNVHT